MAKGKVKSSKAPAFAQGGNKGMFGKQYAGPQKSGTSGKSPSGKGGKFAAGGSGHMFGKQSAGPQKSGRSGQK